MSAPQTDIETTFHAVIESVEELIDSIPEPVYFLCGGAAEQLAQQLGRLRELLRDDA